MVLYTKETRIDNSTTGVHLILPKIMGIQLNTHDTMCARPCGHDFWNGELECSENNFGESGQVKLIVL
jgi:hypothetical protein